MNLYQQLKQNAFVALIVKEMKRNIDKEERKIIQIKK